MKKNVNEQATSKSRNEISENKEKAEIDNKSIVF